MSIRETTRRFPARPALVVNATVAAALFACMGVARADTPEYWTRETFHTERLTVTASLSTADEEDEARPAPRAAPRASITETSRPTRKRERRAAAKTKHVRVASLGTTYVPQAKAERPVTGGGGIRWVASAGCLNGTLRGVLASVAARFGSVTVNSTCRSKRHNARVGGATRSMHLTGNAADFRIRGNWGAASGYIRSMVGGFKHYGGGLFHIDTGVRRTW